MAQWRQIQSLAKNREDVAKRLGNIYKSDRMCLLDIRQSCADWIEGINWQGHSVNDPRIIDIARGHFDDLVRQIDTVIDQNRIDVVKSITLQNSRADLMNNYKDNLLLFLETMQSCLRDEKLLIDSCDPSDGDNLRGRQEEDLAQENPQVQDSLRQLSSNIQMAERELLECINQQNQFRVEYSASMDTITQIKMELQNATMSHAERTQREQEATRREVELHSMINTSFHRRVSASQHHLTVAESTKQIALGVWQEIDQWHNDCKLAITGRTKPKERAVDVLDRMCNHMNQLILQLLAQLDKMKRVTEELQFSSNGQQDLSKKNVEQALLMTEQVLKTHLEKVFVVDKSPPQVMKVVTGKSLGFGMSCRLLGGHALGLQMNPPRVTAELHKEQNFPQCLKSQMKGTCTVVNGRDKQMEMQRETRQWVAHYSSVQLQSVKQPEKNNERLVMENLNAMVFYTSISIRGKTYNLAAVSLPMVHISHVLQDCQAKAFLMWDAAFSQDDSKRKMFDHPETVPWFDVAGLLDALFKKHTGRGLNQKHLNYLGRIAFKEKRPMDPQTLNQRHISKTQLIKDKLQRSFEFWKWFYANMNLIKERLKQEWQDDLIYGFIGKDECNRLLLNRPAGTFMMRFSESDIENSNKADICGCCTMAVVETDPITGNPRVYHVKEHLTPKAIYERGLATTLEAFEVRDRDESKRRLLTYLYPDRPFRETFNKYIIQRGKQASDDTYGYKGGQISIEIFLHDENKDNRGPLSPAPSESSTMPSTPQTPNSMISDMDDFMPQTPAMPQSPPHQPSSMPRSVPTKDGKHRAVALVAPIEPQPSPSIPTTMPDLSQMHIAAAAAANPAAAMQQQQQQYPQQQQHHQLQQQYGQQPQQQYTQEQLQQFAQQSMGRPGASPMFQEIYENVARPMNVVAQGQQDLGPQQNGDSTQAQNSGGIAIQAVEYFDELNSEEIDIDSGPIDSSSIGPEIDSGELIGFLGAIGNDPDVELSPDMYQK